MNQINFSHYYEKFPPGFALSQLVNVRVVDVNELSRSFVDFDTMYIDEYGNKQYFKLPDDRMVIVLLLVTAYEAAGKRALWSTIRRYSLNKLDHYARNVGGWFNCVVVK